MPDDLNLSDQDVHIVAQLLGREPRGLRAIPVRNQSGQPVVLQVASLVDKKPFPTLYWLVDKEINYAIDRLEAIGFIAQWQQRIDDSLEYQQRMMRDHVAHIEHRQQLMTNEDRRDIGVLGFTEPLKKRGIGGIENFTRIRCLHTYYAAHLINANLIGEWLDDLWQQQGLEYKNLIS